jgi:hypothetical protein
MAIRIKDALQLDYVNNLRQITDNIGFDRIITTVGLLDHEIIENNYDVFQKGEFVISTLSVARDDPKMVFSAVKGLIQAQVSGLAIKSVFYHNLPDYILEYANKHEFPIFVFDSMFIEHLINSINQALNSNLLHDVYESKLEAILKGNISRHMMKQLTNELNSTFFDCHYIYFLKEKCFESTDKLIDYADTFLKLSEDYPSYGVFKFRTGLLVVMTYAIKPSKIDMEFSKLVQQLDIMPEQFYIGRSQFHQSSDDLSVSIKEAFTAYQTAEIQNVNYMVYETIGIYKLLIPLLDDTWAVQYSKNIIDPILQYDLQYNAHLYETLKTYFELGCHTKSTAEVLFQHKNTILYRINKVKELIGPFENDLDFNTQLSIAIKLYEGIYQSPTHNII